MRVYHFLNEKFGLDDLRRKRLKLANFDDLNDPFELLAFSGRNRKERAALLFVKSMIDATFGVLCFSRSWKNPVQWSHYADRHRGICLGFDVPASLLTSVEYVAARSQIDISTFRSSAPAGSGALLKLLSTKFSHWSYEDEVRMLVPLRDLRSERGLYFERFSPGLRLRQVIVGHRCSVSRQGITPLVDKDVEVYRARLAFGSFDVVRQKNEKLWQ